MSSSSDNAVVSFDGGSLVFNGDNDLSVQMITFQSASGDTASQANIYLNGGTLSIQVMIK